MGPIAGPEGSDSLVGSDTYLSAVALAPRTPQGSGEGALSAGSAERA